MRIGLSVASYTNGRRIRRVKNSAITVLMAFAGLPTGVLKTAKKDCIVVVLSTICVTPLG